MSEKPPVVVELVVSWPGINGSESEPYEIDRDRWDAMTPAEREADINQAAEEFATNYVNWGWSIDDPGDAAAVANN